MNEKKVRSLRNSNRRPTHPGAILREDVLPKLRMTLMDLANHLRVSPLTVSKIVHEKISVSAEMAVRLSKVVGGTPESWLYMQEAVDLWEVE